MAATSLSRAFWWRLALIGVFLGLLEIYGRLYADPAFMSPPSKIFDAFLTRIVPEPKINEALFLCVLQIAAAYALSILCGVITGFLIGATSFTRSAFMPIVLLLFAIPQVSLLPLVILLFGVGPAAKIAFGFSHGVLPTSPELTNCMLRSARKG